MKRWLPGLLCMVLSGLALAAGPNEARKRVQASMLVTGSIEVAQDGGVRQYALDQGDKLPPQVQQLLAKAISAWRFRPVQVNGKPVIAKAKMGVRVVAKPVGDGDYNIEVGPTWFGNPDDSKEGTAETVTYKHRVMPTYPTQAVVSRVAGTVYVLMKVGRDGLVEDVVAEQVDLGVLGSDRELKKWRQVLAEAATSALRRETFNTPTTGVEAGKPYWVIRCPVTFALTGFDVPASEGNPRYGQWQAYVPGPAAQLPEWAHPVLTSGGSDAMPEGGSLLADSTLQLQTPPNGG